MYTVSPKTIKFADNLAVTKYGISSLTLMKNAAKACFDVLAHKFSVSDHRFVVLCGKGGNGGDGYELCTLLKNEGFDVCAINVLDCEPVTEDSLAVYETCKSGGVEIVPFSCYEEKIRKSDVLVDAVFGVGFAGNIEKDSDIGRLLLLCNELCAVRIAIDTPSGINSADGTVSDVVFNADTTLTMAYIKTGMLSYPARRYCGNIITLDIGYPEGLCEDITFDALIPDDEYIESVIPKRAAESHKGSCGRLLMYVGSETMTGAAILSATAALRSGIGLVNIANDRETIKTLQQCLAEPVFSILKENKKDELLSLSKKASAILVGCGLGTDDEKTEVLLHLIKNAECPIIIDADGINMLCSNKMILKEAKHTPTLTPHPLEFARLLGQSIELVQANRLRLAKEFAKEYGCVLVLKGANTVIASPDGRLSVNTTGNPGLATGGSGDVLAGLVGSLYAGGLCAFDAATAGVYLHGKAADVLKEEISECGLLPSDLPLAIAKLLP